MGHWLSYTLTASILLIVMWTVYKLLMSGDKQPAINRLTILGCFLFAVLLPLIDFPAWNAHDSRNIIPGTLQIEPVTTNAIPEIPLDTTLFRALIIVYLAGIGVTTCLFLVAQARLYLIIKKGKQIDHEGRSIILVDMKDIIPFSYFNRIVMPAADFNSLNRSMILAHELAHIKHKHSYDLLLTNLFCIALWYNPAAWAFAAELRATHEYEADAEVIRKGFPRREYQLTLLKKAIGRSFPVLANSLNHSNLKKRITMMQKSNSSKSRRARVLALIPAIALGLAVVNTPLVSNALERLSDTGISAISNSKGSEKISSVENTVAKTIDDEQVVDTPEVLPKYPGGEAAMMKFLMENLEFPQSEINRVGRFPVIVKFVVGSNGKVRDIEIANSQGEAFDNEAKRVVSLFPDFIPGKVDGKPVAVSYSLPVVFSIPAKKGSSASK